MQMILGLIFAAIFVYVGVNLEPGLVKVSPSSQRWLEQTHLNGGSLRWLSRAKQQIKNLWACVTTLQWVPLVGNEKVWTVNNRNLQNNKNCEYHGSHDYHAYVQLGGGGTQRSNHDCLCSHKIHCGYGE